MALGVNLVGCVTTKIYNAPEISDAALCYATTHPTDEKMR